MKQLPDDVRHVVIEVADTGIGMTEATQARLFQKFTQADSSISRQFGGTGLGLAISRELVGLMSGTIAVTSKLGEGSRFLVTLPLLPPVGAVPGGGPHVSAPDEAPTRALHVLVADDNRINRRLVVALLEAAGHTVDVATNGREAVEAVVQTRYDVVLMDAQMPVMDGVQATRRIRGLPAPLNAVPIVALTADAISGAEDRYRGAGMDAYLSKPLSPQTLMATMDALARGERGKKPTAPAVDPAAITELRKFLDDAQFTAFIAEAVRDLAVRIDGLEVRIAAGDMEPAAREAHDLVSAAGNCGACAVTALARSIEQAARQGDAAEAEQLFAGMRAAGGRAAEALAQLIGA